MRGLMLLAWSHVAADSSSFSSAIGTGLGSGRRTGWSSGYVFQQFESLDFERSAPVNEFTQLAYLVTTGLTDPNVI